MTNLPTAAIVTIGTELTAGLRLDTNGQEIARSLAGVGFDVRVMTSLPDDADVVEAQLKALIGSYSLIVVTGGLGPTHDDITRQAAAGAVGRALYRDDAVAAVLAARPAAHERPDSRERMLLQADVIEGAAVLPAVAGTAPGQVVHSGDSTLLLLPGPPHEMRPLLDRFLSPYRPSQPPVRLRCTGITESDAGHAVIPAIAPFLVDFTLLAAPGDVEVILFARDGDASDLPAAAAAARGALGDACYSDDGSSLAETVQRLGREAGELIASAESCTGGLVAAALTDNAGASDVFTGAIVSYADDVKSGVLGVAPSILALHGAVSEETARAMAEGALEVCGASLAVATTGVAGPGGGATDKPVGLVWFAVARAGGTTEATSRRFGGDRSTVRRRATATALDVLRLTMERR